MTKELVSSEEVVSLEVIEGKAIVDSAVAQARLLMDIVEKQGLYQEIRGKKYLQVEAWQLLGQFSGLTARVKSCVEVRVGDTDTFRAEAVLLDKEGNEVGYAVSYCGKDEDRWAKASVKDLASMAQTRAVSKVYRLRLSFIAALAGYEPTPAEEIEERGGRKEVERKVELSEEAERIRAFNWMDAYQKCTDEFGVRATNEAVVQEGFDPTSLPASREAWVRIWKRCKRNLAEAERRFRAAVDELSKEG